MNNIKTSLYTEHSELGAKIIPFAGYLMPVNYKEGLTKEYSAVRNQVGIFDVSHMGQLSIEGTGSSEFLNYVTVNKENEIIRKIIVQKPSKIMSKFICFIPSTTFFFKRKIIERNIFIDKNFYIAMDKEFFANLLSKNYKLEKVDKFLAKFRWHDANKSIDTLKIIKIRCKEGLIIFNRYFKIKLPNNIIGIILLVIMGTILKIYRFICKKFGFGIFSK